METPRPIADDLYPHIDRLIRSDVRRKITQIERTAADDDLVQEGYLILRQYDEELRACPAEGRLGLARTILWQRLTRTFLSRAKEGGDARKLRANNLLSFTREDRAKRSGEATLDPPAPSGPTHESLVADLLASVSPKMRARIAARLADPNAPALDRGARLAVQTYLEKHL